MAEADFKSLRSSWGSWAPAHLFLQLNCSLNHWSLQKAKILHVPQVCFSSMLLIRGNYRKKIRLTPCLVPTPRWVSHSIQAKTGLEAKMSRLVRASGCGTGMEMYLGPLGHILPPIKEMCPSATHLRLWQILPAGSEELEKNKRRFVYPGSSRHLVNYHERFIEPDSQLRGLHTSTSLLNGLFRKNGTSLSGTGQLCHLVETHKCADNP